MRLPDKGTYGELLGPAMQITIQKEADEYYEALVERNMRISDNSRAEAERIVKSNLGYYAGYYDDETAKRVYELFKCNHPVFGDNPFGISAEEAFEAGEKTGVAIKVLKNDDAKDKGN